MKKLSFPPRKLQFLSIDIHRHRTMPPMKNKKVVRSRGDRNQHFVSPARERGRDRISHGIPHNYLRLPPQSTWLIINPLSLKTQRTWRNYQDTGWVWYYVTYLYPDGQFGRFWELIFQCRRLSTSSRHKFIRPNHRTKESTCTSISASTPHKIGKPGCGETHSFYE